MVCLSANCLNIICFFFGKCTRTLQQNIYINCEYFYFSIIATMATTETPCPTLSSHLTALHKKLTLDDFYLGSPVVRSYTEWKMFGNGKQLAKAFKEPVSSQDSTTQSNASSATSPSQPSINNLMEQEPVILVLVAHVSTQSYFFTTDGCFKQPVVKMETIKPSCLLEKPEFPILTDNFTSVIDNITWLENLAATRGYEKQGIVKTEAGVNRICLWHILFAVCNSSISDKSPN